MDFDTRLSPEGRVVIPAAVRAALGVGPGDRVRFTVHAGVVQLMTAQSLLDVVWANNHGGDREDAVTGLRDARRHDQAKAAAKWERVAAAAAADDRSEEEVEAGLLTALGIAP